MGPGDFPTNVVATAGQISLQPRAETMAALRDLGFHRFIAGVPGLANTFETLDEFLEEATAAGLFVPAGAFRQTTNADGSGAGVDAVLT
jgi:hypothetical protein